MPKMSGFNHWYRYKQVTSRCACYCYCRCARVWCARRARGERSLVFVFERMRGTPEHRSLVARWAWLPSSCVFLGAWQHAYSNNVQNGRRARRHAPRTLLRLR